MKRFLILAGLLVIASTVPATAAEEIQTTVTFKSWEVYFNGNAPVRKVPTRNGTVTHCKSNSVNEIDGVGSYKKAKPGKKFRVIWKRNGELFYKYESQWLYKSGNFKPNLSGGFAGLKDGNYVVIVKQSGQRLG